MVESSVAEKAMFFGAVGEQISLDRCARKFILNGQHHPQGISLQPLLSE
jgi:hypothetical protein